VATFYCDPVNGDDANDGTSWANAWKTLTNGATAARIAPGDTIKIAKSADPVNTGVNATFTNGSGNITIASALTKDIFMCESAFTPAANVTCNTTSSYIAQGSYSAYIYPASAFTTGLMAYKDLGSAQDFSAYTKISFFLINTGAIAANTLRICLCSDANGTVVVDSFPISFALPALTTSNGFAPITLARSGGGNLGSNIRSIAVYADLDPGTPYLYLDNIIACNDLSLNCLIGKNDSEWWPIQALSGTTLTTGLYGTTIGYYGTSETVPLYYRVPSVWSLAPQSSSDNWGNINKSGTSGNLITFSGGWNTSTSLQDGMTYIDMCNYIANGFYSYQKDYLKIENIGIVRAVSALYISVLANRLELNNIEAISIISPALYFSPNVAIKSITGILRFIDCRHNWGPVYIPSLSTNPLVGNIYTANVFIRACWAGINIASVGGQGYNIWSGTIDIRGINASAVLIYASNWTFSSIKIEGLSANGWVFYIAAGVNNTFIDFLEVQGMERFCQLTSSSYSSSLRIGRCSFLDGVPTLDTTNFFYTGGTSNYQGQLMIDLLNANRRFLLASTFGGWITDQVTAGQAESWAHGGDGVCVYMNPISQVYPLEYRFYVPVAANQATTIKFYVKKTSSTANCTLKLTILGCGTTPVIDNDVSLTDTWTEYQSPSLMPTVDGFLTCILWARDGSVTGDIGIDDIRTG
jgi:hypothetical protein